MSSPLLGTIICIMYLDDAGFEEVKKIQNRKRIFPKCSLGDIRVRSVVLNYLILMVPEAGIEPARRCQRGILNPLCLPISPLGLSSITKRRWRRVPESNRTRRICNPLHNRFVNAP